MTDSRLPERYLNDRRINRLSAEHFRSYVMATLWSVSNRTDGVLTVEDLTLIPGFSATAPAALYAAELWVGIVGGWTIEDFANTQTSKHDLGVLDNARRADREKKRRQRADRKAAGPTFQGDDPGDNPGDVSRGTTQDRTGQARTGQARSREGSTKKKSELVNPQTGEVTESQPLPMSWPTAVPGAGQDQLCGVCNKKLLSPQSKRAGVCGKTDAAHKSARAA